MALNCTICAPKCATCENKTDLCTYCRGDNRVFEIVPACNCEEGYYDDGVN